MQFYLFVGFAGAAVKAVAKAALPAKLTVGAVGIALAGCLSALVM
ncbi:MAG TPA: hypothetical protein VET30_04045 [Pseudoxanthomonas sp.]|nr:hypothetical protein [Pseudoxanthomonas sp.]